MGAPSEPLRTPIAGGTFAPPPSDSSRWQVGCPIPVVSVAGPLMAARSRSPHAAAARLRLLVTMRASRRSRAVFAGNGEVRLRTEQRGLAASLVSLLDRPRLDFGFAPVVPAQGVATPARGVATPAQEGATPAQQVTAPAQGAADLAGARLFFATLVFALVFASAMGVRERGVMGDCSASLVITSDTSACVIIRRP